MMTKSENQLDSNEYFNVATKFNLDDIDNWTTTTGLIKQAIDSIQKTIPFCAAHLFYHETETHEYREIDREGIATIPDDSLFIGCLSMLPGAVPLENLFSDYKIDDPLLEHLLVTVYQGKYIVPIVHSFELLSFILICNETAGSPVTFDDDSLPFLKELVKRLKINLYASSVADQRQRELLSMSVFPVALQKHQTLEEIYSHM